MLAVSPGPYVTIQDAGRRGWRRFGVACAGAMDIVAFELANALVGNAPGTAALEFAHVGGAWQIDADACRIAITGGGFAISADGVALRPWRSHTLRRGQRVSIGGALDAVWGYLAVSAGFDISPRLGSVATHVRSGLGGMNGRRIAEGDAIPLLTPWPPTGPELQAAAPIREEGPMRVVLGPQVDFFTKEMVEQFFTGGYRMSHRSDRMGAWLDGPRIGHAGGYNVLSDGLVPGCIQVPGSGQPVVLLMDCQTIGGYPKLATIITADLARFAQTRPGIAVTFTAVDIETAQSLYRDYRARLDHVDELVNETVRAAEPGSRPHW